MQTLFSELEAAMDADLTPKVMDILVEVARGAIYHDDKTFAIEILALALQYPMRVETLRDAEQLYSDLEIELCPSVIYDACEQAQRLTLEDMVARVLTQSAD